MFFNSRHRQVEPAKARARACDKKFVVSLDAPNNDIGEVSFLAPIGIWNNGSELIVHPNAIFPPRCVYTNVVCGDAERQIVRWQSPIKGLYKTKPMQFSFSVSRSTRWSQRTLMIAGVAIFALGLGSFGLSLKFLLTQWPLFILIMSGVGLISVGVLIMWIAFGSLRFGPAAPAPYVAIFGCGRDFMDSFPYSDELVAQFPKYIKAELNLDPGDVLD